MRDKVVPSGPRQKEMEGTKGGLEVEKQAEDDIDRQFEFFWVNLHKEYCQNSCCSL